MRGHPDTLHESLQILLDRLFKVFLVHCLVCNAHGWLFGGLVRAIFYFLDLHTTAGDVAAELRSDLRKVILSIAGCLLPQLGEQTGNYDLVLARKS